MLAAVLVFVPQVHSTVWKTAIVAIVVGLAVLEITAEVVDHQRRPEKHAPLGTVGRARQTLIIATPLDAARALIQRLIKQGEELQATFVPYPQAADPESLSPELARTHLRLIDHLSRMERSLIADWHQGVIRALTGIGGGALGLYGANEGVSHDLFGALRMNRRFLQDRLNELRAIAKKIDSQIRACPSSRAAGARFMTPPLPSLSKRAGGFWKRARLQDSRDARLVDEIARLTAQRDYYRRRWIMHGLVYRWPYRERKRTALAEAQLIDRGHA